MIELAARLLGCQASTDYLVCQPAGWLAGLLTDCVAGLLGWVVEAGGEGGSACWLAA